MSKGVEIALSKGKVMAVSHFFVIPLLKYHLNTYVEYFETSYVTPTIDLWKRKTQFYSHPFCS